MTLLLLFVFAYKVKNFDVVDDSVLSGIIYEIKSEDFFINVDNYAVDNFNFFLYISNFDEDIFEAAFKEYITNNNLNSNIIYFNGWNKIDNSFVKKFKNNFFAQNLENVNISYLKQSNIYVFRNGKVVDLLYDRKNKINIEDVKNFIEGFDDIYD